MRLHVRFPMMRSKERMLTMWRSNARMAHFVPAVLWRAGLALALLALVCVSAAPAAARELHIHTFHAEIVVMPDSSIDVTETIGVEFVGSFQGIYRTIPVEYDGPGGFNYSLFITNVSATDGAGGDGAPLRIEKSRQGGNMQFKIYVPGASDVSRSISLHYHVSNG